MSDKRGIPYSGGPLDGHTYPLERGQPAPLEIRHPTWRGQYTLRAGVLEWGPR